MVADESWVLLKSILGGPPLRPPTVSPKHFFVFIRMVLAQTYYKEAHVTLSGATHHQGRNSTNPDAVGGYGHDHDDDRPTDEVCPQFYHKNQQGVPDSLTHKGPEQLASR